MSSVKTTFPPHNGLNAGRPTLSVYAPSSCLEDASDLAVMVAWIADVDDPEFELLSPIQLAVEKLDEGNYVARMPTADIHASGNSLEEAVENWKDALRVKFAHYSSFPAKKLSRGALHNLCQMSMLVAWKRD